MNEKELCRLAGSVVMMGFRGLTAQPGELIYRQLQELHLGGVILFDKDMSNGEVGRNIVGPAQLAELTSQLQQATNQFLLIAVDQEGGRVARLNTDNGYLQFPSAAEIGEKFDPAETELVASQMARLLREAGININFAPVVDLNLNPTNPIIGAWGRSFSENPQQVIQHSRAFMAGHRQQQVACVLKHFPGHGSSAADSHQQTVDVTATYQDQELQPYKALALEADMVMIGHLRHRGFDPELPASLSAKLIKGLLRQQIGFEGVVVTDDLDMAAVAGDFELQRRTTLALNAGVDLLLFGNNVDYDPHRPRQVVDAIVSAVAAGDVTLSTLKQHASQLDRLRWRLADGSGQPPPTEPAPARQV